MEKDEKAKIETLLGEYCEALNTADADKAVRQAWITLGPTASTEALIKKALG